MVSESAPGKVPVKRSAPAAPNARLVTLSGVGPKREEMLNEAGLETLLDLLYFFPLRYDDRRQLQPVGSLADGERACVKVKVTSAGHLHRRRRLTFVKVRASAVVRQAHHPEQRRREDGALHLVWFNQPYMAGRFDPGQELLVTGRVRKRGRDTSLVVENWQVAEPQAEPLQVGRIVPIYPLVKGLERIGQTTLRRWIRQAVELCAGLISDRLPEEMRERLALEHLPQALKDIHLPDDPDAADRARRRLAFEELFFLQLSFLQRAMENRRASAPRIPGGFASALEMAEVLPFRLTSAQRRSLEEICQDLASGQPMNRLLQGDVGSGKTLVAALAGAAVVKNGFQVAFMAPTEVLAIQHFRVLSDFLGEWGIEVDLLIGSLDGTEKESVRGSLESGKPMLVVGTHALIQEAVEFARLGLAVIDEQHRFGVSQRATLRQKGSPPKPGRTEACHILVMTATPIPRTLTLAFYGDLDVSLIDEMPPGRTAVRTCLMSREKAHQELAQHLTAGGQAYVVCPAIEASEPEMMENSLLPGFGPGVAAEWPEEPLTSVLPLAEKLKAGPLASYEVETLHGRMSREEKEEKITRFRAGSVQALIATTVIEVGMDVPNATMMVIEDAERFGLAQLHQLRGRVGRGEAASVCLLVASSPRSQYARRLRILLETNDGFRIAEEDLRLRGPGEFYGFRQHGMPELRAASLVTDLHILVLAREEARKLLEKDPTLSEPEHIPLRPVETAISPLVDHA